MGGWSDGVWTWGDFGVSEVFLSNPVIAEELCTLRSRLEDFRGWNFEKDIVLWTGNSKNSFSVASCYSFYDSIRYPFGPSNIHEGAFGLLWKLEVPFKIKVFGWRLFLNRLPTKDLLEIRGMHFSHENLLCTFCGNCMESRNHLFFSCGVVKKIWGVIASWVGKGESVSEECLSNFMDWHLFFSVNMVKDRKLGIIWLATSWAIWLDRNGVCFRNESWNVNDIVWNIKLLAWRWTFCGNITRSNFSFYEFCKDPLFFLSSLRPVYNGYLEPERTLKALRRQQCAAHPVENPTIANLEKFDYPEIPE
ncbi:uncharacterized protein LOC131597459 [Vicia villosa]|uniref:uncharacterized protein LOC131597459 n=1 Tax=Vicia villosa TaxID=3911 RepID=UPI00273BA963|nr:uncharacterized protein LOC131597459 [Vicia villosa]